MLYCILNTVIMIDFYLAILVAQKVRHCLPLFLSIAKIWELSEMAQNRYLLSPIFELTSAIN